MTGHAPDPDTRTFDAMALIDAAAPACGLSITHTQRPGVAQFLTLAHAMAAQLMAAPLADDVLEPAPVFRPGGAPPVPPDEV